MNISNATLNRYRFRYNSYLKLLFVKLISNKTKQKMSSFKPQVVFVLGGPGAGKGTQCDLICKVLIIDFYYNNYELKDCVFGTTHRSL